MNQWYYADAQRRQIGPVPASELVQLHQAGQVDDATLVWREGLANWQPLGTVRAELGLEAPVPPAPEAALPPADAAAPAAMAATAPAVLSPGADDVVYAGLWKRVAASLIDSLVTSTITYAAAIPLFLVYGVSTTALFGLRDLQDGPPLAFWAVYYLLALGLPALYFAWMHSSSTQASLGKMAVGVKVPNPASRFLLKPLMASGRSRYILHLMSLFSRKVAPRSPDRLTSFMISISSVTRFFTRK